MTQSTTVAAAIPERHRLRCARWSGILILLIGVTVLGLGLAHQVAVQPRAVPAVVVIAQALPSEVAPEHLIGTPAPLLPETSAPLSFSLRVVADRELSQPERLKPLVDGSTVIIDDPAGILALRRILRDPDEGDTLRNECANALRVNEASDLADDLRVVLADRRNGDRFRSFATQHLGVLFEADPSDLKLRDDLRAALGDQAVEVRREALWPLSRQGDPVGLAQAEVWLRDPTQSAVHDLCCRIAAQAARHDWLEPVRALVASQDEVVSAAAQRAVAVLEAGS